MSMTFDDLCNQYEETSGFRITAATRTFAEAIWHAAQAQCAAGPWQDIKDAPKDGSEVLIITKAEGGVRCIYVGSWDEDDVLWRDDNQYIIYFPTHFAPLREVRP